MRTMPEPPEPELDAVEGEYPAPPPPEPVFSIAGIPRLTGELR